MERGRDATFQLMIELLLQNAASLTSLEGEALRLRGTGLELLDPLQGWIEVARYHGSNVSAPRNAQPGAYLFDSQYLPTSARWRHTTLTIKVVELPDGAELHARAGTTIAAVDPHGFRLRASMRGLSLQEASGSEELLLLSNGETDWAGSFPELVIAEPSWFDQLQPVKLAAVRLGRPSALALGQRGAA